MLFPVDEFRKNFPQLTRRIHGHPLVYFDNAASTLQHSRVSDQVDQYNRNQVSNVHRGSHTLSRESTNLYEEARIRVQKFIGASSPEEIIFTRGTTESINLVAHILSLKNLSPSDEILISPFEHHSNTVPWQMVCERVGCSLKVWKAQLGQGFCKKSFLSALSSQTKVCSFLWYSNSFGHGLPVEYMVKECRQRGIHTLIDAAQVPLTEKIDVGMLDTDFLCFSGHKMFAPYGIGILYGRKSLLETLPPYGGGGGMVDRVTFEHTKYGDLPYKYESGTPHIPGAVGLSQAMDIIESLDFKAQHEHTLALRENLQKGLEDLGVLFYDFESSNYTGVLSFNVPSAHCTDVADLLDGYGVAVRAGHHCNQPIMDVIGVPGTVRVSLTCYNTQKEVDIFLKTIKKVITFF